MNLPLSIDKDFHAMVMMHQASDAAFKARDKELKPYGLSGQEAATLFIIQAIGNKVTPAHIARWLFREHHTVSALLGRMEKKGLIKKAKDPHRKNIWRVGLTDKGRKAYRQSIKWESIHEVMSTLSDDERQQLISSLNKVRDQALKYLVIEPTIPFP